MRFICITSSAGRIQLRQHDEPTIEEERDRFYTVLAFVEREGMTIKKIIMNKKLYEFLGATPLYEGPYGSVTIIEGD